MKIDNDFLDEIYKECVRERNEAAEGSNDHCYFSGIIHFIESLQALDKDIDLSNANDSLKEYALSIMDDLEENEKHNFETHSYVYQWRYDERPDILVTLVLGDFEIFNLQDEGDLH